MNSSEWESHGSKTYLLNITVVEGGAARVLQTFCDELGNIMWTHAMKHDAIRRAQELLASRIVSRYESMSVEITDRAGNSVWQGHSTARGRRG